MNFYNDFNDMFSSQGTFVLNMAYEKSPGVFIVKDEKASLLENGEVCRVFESPECVIDGKTRSVELVVNGKYWPIVESAVRKFCAKFYGSIRCVDLGMGHFAFDYSHFYGPLDSFLESDIDHLDSMIQSSL